MAEAGGLQDITNIDATPIPAGEPRQASVGESLRAAREAAGLDIKQLALRTRVTVRHLEALEAGDYAALPGRP
ncbi:MAG: helix-turn-helix transcriptional regulator, partial [Pseudomonadota bacterium]